MPNPKSGLFDEYACTTVPVLNVNMKYNVKDCKERERASMIQTTQSIMFLTSHEVTLLRPGCAGSVWMQECESVLRGGPGRCWAALFTHSEHTTVIRVNRQIKIKVASFKFLHLARVGFGHKNNRTQSGSARSTL